VTVLEQGRERTSYEKGDQRGGLLESRIKRMRETEREREREREKDLR
jgi:hypothetical protein